MTANPLSCCASLYVFAWVVMLALVTRARSAPAVTPPPVPLRVQRARAVYRVVIRPGHDGRLVVIVDPRDNIVLTAHQQEMSKWN